LFFGAAQASATDAIGDGGDLQRFHPEPTPLGGIAATSGEILEATSWGVGLHLNYARNPLVYRRSDERVASSVLNNLTTHVHGGIGVGGWGEFSFALPVVTYQDSNDPQMSTLASAQVGDLRVMPRFRILTQWRSGIALSVSPTFTVPLGGAKALAGEPGFN